MKTRKTEASKMDAKKMIDMLTGYLWLALIVFQAMTMAFLAYREETVNMIALYMAVVLPCVSILLYWIVVKLMKADRILLLTMLFLCSVSLAISNHQALYRWEYTKIYPCS